MNELIKMKNLNIKHRIKHVKHLEDKINDHRDSIAHLINPQIGGNFSKATVRIIKLRIDSMKNEIVEMDERVRMLKPTLPDNEFVVTKSNNGVKYYLTDQTAVELNGRIVNGINWSQNKKDSFVFYCIDDAKQFLILDVQRPGICVEEIE